MQLNSEPQSDKSKDSLNRSFAQLHTITPLSRGLAILLFILLPFAGGYVGWMYASDSYSDTVVSSPFQTKNPDGLFSESTTTIRASGGSAVSTTEWVLKRNPFQTIQTPCEQNRFTQYNELRTATSSSSIDCAVIVMNESLVDVVTIEYCKEDCGFPDIISHHYFNGEKLKDFPRTGSEYIFDTRDVLGTYLTIAMDGIYTYDPRTDKKELVYTKQENEILVFCEGQKCTTDEPILRKINNEFLIELKVFEKKSQDDYPVGGMAAFTQIRSIKIK